MPIEYIGEQAHWGKIGHALAVLSFVAALAAMVAYAFTIKHGSERKGALWLPLANRAFFTHMAAVGGIILLMFYLLLSHQFQYQYVWQHSNKSMPLQYILSCFWEGQEGSFLLWTFWNMLLGFVLIRKAGSWTPGVMLFVSSIQVFLATMLLGTYLGDLKIGSSPFLLLREHADFMNLPFLASAEYVSNLDGRGLNPLLQNYWMTIHPPTLFLGFSLTMVPFAYAMAGLLSKQYQNWIKPALPWTYAGVMVLGLGILMGGAWAYEALSFGGFWAWDPVENASLVPWLTLVSAAHVMMIAKNRGESQNAAMALSIITFILILYSTFLTRSGILGDTSVHAFTDLGMSGQLLLYLLFFALLPAYFVIQKKTWKWGYAIICLLIWIWCIATGFQKSAVLFLVVGAWLVFLLQLNKINSQSKKPEEDISSREFWMFIGALVLILSAFQVIVSTSTPVINKMIRGTFITDVFHALHGWTGMPLFEKAAQAEMATPKDAVQHYNAWQVPFAIIIVLLMAVTQFMKYKKTPGSMLFRRLLPSLLASLVITAILVPVIEMYQPVYVILMFAALFSTFSNADYLLRVLKGNLRKGGASIAHIGFALIVLGALISGGKKEFISKNVSPFDLGKDFPNNENVLLPLNEPVALGNYWVIYRGDSVQGINIYYKVDYFKTQPIDAQAKPVFTLYPRVQTNPKMGNVAEPSTKHYLHKDIFTHVTYAKLEKHTDKVDDDGYKAPSQQWVKEGDTIYLSNHMLVIDRFLPIRSPEEEGLMADDIAMKVETRLLSIFGEAEALSPVFFVRGNQKRTRAAESEKEGVRLGASDVDPTLNSVMLILQEKESNDKDFIIMKAIIFPGINVLWIGSILMVIGIFAAVRERLRNPQRNRAA